MHTASMPNILVRDVPSEVHAHLLVEARSHGQSLQQFLQDTLAAIVHRPRTTWTAQQAVDEIEQWAQGLAAPGTPPTNKMTGADLIRGIRGPLPDGE